MDVANSLADVIDTFTSAEKVSQEIDQKRNRNTLEEFERDSTQVAKFDPEDDVPDIEDLYDRLTDEDGLEYDAVQIGGTFGVESNGFMDWVEAADELSSMAEEENDGELSILAEPSEQSHVLEQNEPEKAVLEPDYFTVPRITNTDQEEYKDGLHREFVGKMNGYIESIDVKEAVGKYVSERIKNHAKGKIPSNDIAQSAGEKILNLSGNVIDEVGEKKFETYLNGLEGVEASDADDVLRDIFWSQWITEDYFVTNPKASVATKTGADEWLKGKKTTDLMHNVQEEIRRSAETWEPRYRAQSVFYIEGSGAQTPPEIIKAADLARKEYDLDIQILYGGGIENEGGEPDLIRHDEFELEYDLSNNKLQNAGFDHEEFEDISYDPEDLTGQDQIELVREAGADTYIQGNSIQV